MTNDDQDLNSTEPPDTDVPDDAPSACLLDMQSDDLLLPELPRPFDWNRPTAVEAEADGTALDTWVNWLRRTHEVTAAIIPMYGHVNPNSRGNSGHYTFTGSAPTTVQQGSAPLRWHLAFACVREGPTTGLLCRHPRRP